jgi:hypothetical protein
MTIQGDLDKTAAIDDLLRIHPSARTEGWTKRLLTHLAGASFCCGEPQVITGPDGFPYFQLLMPKTGKEFESFCINQMKDEFLLLEGLGVVLNANLPQPTLVLSYGDILNLFLNGEFYSSTPDDASKKMTGTKPTEKNVHRGEPSELFLPKIAHEVINRFFEANHLHHPKIFLTHQKEGKIELQFNFSPKDFPSMDHFCSFFDMLGWYLPRHYIYSAER